MLRHANPSYEYHLYVIHSSNISISNQTKLKETIKEFPNATLTFIDMGGKFDEMWEKCKGKFHFSKEVFYKLSVPNLFAQYDKAIISDVDVVWLGDIAEVFESFDINEDYYLGGYDGPKPNFKIANFTDNYKRDFTQDEIDKLKVGAGLLVYNLSKMRQDKIEEKMLQYALDNAYRLLLPEQDVINLVCHPKIKILPKGGMVAISLYMIYDSDEKLENASWSKEEILYAMENPIQLHYAGGEKPWRDFGVLKCDEWLKALVQTNYLQDFLAQIALYRQVYVAHTQAKVFIKIPPLFTLSKLNQRIQIDMFGFVIILPKCVFEALRFCKNFLIKNR